MKAFGYDLSPALHSAAAKVIELPTGTSSAKFLMSTNYLFIMFSALRGDMEKSILKSFSVPRGPLQSLKVCAISKRIDMTSE